MVDKITEDNNMNILILTKKQKEYIDLMMVIEKASIKEFQNHINKDRSTIQKQLKILCDTNVIIREKNNCKRGFNYLYSLNIKYNVPTL